MICPKCHYNNRDSSQKCISCGSSLVNDNSSIKEEDTSSKINLQNINPFSFIEVIQNIITGILSVIVGFYFTISLLSFAFTTKEMIIKIVIIPFLICCIAVVILGIERLLNIVNHIRVIKEFRNGNVEKANILAEKGKHSLIGYYIYQFGFFLFWFGVLSFCDYYAIKTWSTGGNQLFFFSLLFWIVGIYIFLKNRKE